MRILVSVSCKVISLWRGHTPSLGENPIHLPLLMCDPHHEKPLSMWVINKPDVGRNGYLRGTVEELGAFCTQDSRALCVWMLRMFPLDLYSLNIELAHDEINC